MTRPDAGDSRAETAPGGGGPGGSSGSGGSAGAFGSGSAVGSGNSTPTGGADGGSGEAHPEGAAPEVAPGDAAVGGADARIADTGGADARIADTGGADVALPDVLPPPVLGITTDPDLKIAFIGDTTDDAPEFKSVLALVKSEGAHGMVVNGDLSYTDDANAWWATVEGVLGDTYPIFLSEGNHDSPSWDAYQPRANAHVAASGATVDPVKIGNRAYHYTFRGLSMVFVGEDLNPDYPKFMMERFAGDKHLWKVCGFHKLMAAMQIGGKTDEAGWGVYEACRQSGALIMTAHEHSYERTKTLTSTSSQTVDPTCSDPKSVCVAPGRVPVFVSGIGGSAIRDQLRCLPTTYPYGCKQEWAFIYTTSQAAKHGALFVVFNHQGNPRKAHGYFKNIAGQVVDEFDITSQ